MVFQSCLTARAEPDRGIVGLRELEFLGVGGLPVMDELEPLKKTGPFKQQFTSGAPLRAAKLEIARAAAVNYTRNALQGAPSPVLRLIFVRSYIIQCTITFGTSQPLALGSYSSFPPMVISRPSSIV